MWHAHIHIICSAVYPKAKMIAVIQKSKGLAHSMTGMEEQILTIIDSKPSRAIEVRVQSDHHK